MTGDERSATLRAGCASSAPAHARAFVLRTGREWGLTDTVIEAAQLAASELVSNSVEHALSGVQVTLALAGKQLRIAVRDHSKAPPVRRTPTAAGARGRGIALVDAVSEEWGVLPHPDGKTVWLVLTTADGGSGQDMRATNHGPATGGQRTTDAAANRAPATDGRSAAEEPEQHAAANRAPATDGRSTAEEPAATAPASVLVRPEVVEVPHQPAE